VELHIEKSQLRIEEEDTLKWHSAAESPSGLVFATGLKSTVLERGSGKPEHTL
jgi:hypothetical protein